MSKLQKSLSHTGLGWASWRKRIYVSENKVKPQALLGGTLFCQILQATCLCPNSLLLGHSGVALQEQYSWFPGGVRNGSRGPSSLEDRVNGEQILLNPEGGR